MKKIINVKVSVKSKNTQITTDKDNPNKLKIKLTKPPSRGEANAQLINILSEYYHIPKNNILIISGAKSRDKIIRVTI